MDARRELPVAEGTRGQLQSLLPDSSLSACPSTASLQQVEFQLPLKLFLTRPSCSLLSKECVWLSYLCASVFVYETASHGLWVLLILLI